MRMITILVFIFFAVRLSAQHSLFDKEDILNIDIVTDLRALIRDVNPENAKYHKGLLTYINSSGDNVSIAVKLKTRGIFRRSKDNCNFPPLTIKFSEDTVESYFTNIDKLKLVNVCNWKRELFQQYLIKEYLVYKIYNLLTDYSFRVRMVKILYVDINSAISPFETFGFLIEDMNSLNRRTNSKPIKTLGIVQEATNRLHMDITAIFQYFIGNTDWSVPKQHNIKLVVSDSDLIPIAIPYDFDFCGFVNPPYTKPPEIIPILHVTQRYYRGFCRTPKELEPSLEIFQQKRPDVYSLIENDTLLRGKHKKHVLDYIDEFYRVIDSPRLLHRELIENCRKE
jgi:hypothetical protein